jgi:hypothetical protein
MDYVKANRIILKTHPAYSEKWVQEKLAADPSLLGLGDLVLRDKERPQPRAGRLDLLFQAAEEKRRYEVELQLGPTDESHIIRTIEYWDIEKRRYPLYDHVAVLIAEDITSRFLNVVSLLNGRIPIVAIQMQAYDIGNNQLTLVFTKVIDELAPGLADEEEDAASAPSDRPYWEAKATKDTVGLVDSLLPMVHELDPQLRLKYNKFYIGLEKNDQSNNFVQFRPQKRGVVVEFRLPQSAETDVLIDHSGLESNGYDRWGRYRLRVSSDDIIKHRDVLSDLMHQAFDEAAM